MKAHAECDRHRQHVQLLKTTDRAKTQTNAWSIRIASHGKPRIQQGIDNGFHQLWDTPYKAQKCYKM